MKSIFDAMIETAKGLGDKKLLQKVKNLKKQQTAQGASSIEEMPIVKLKEGVKTYEHNPSKAIIELYESLDDENIVTKHYNKTSKNGTLLRAARKKEGLTQEELSQKLWGTEKRYLDIAKMEKGERTINEDLALKLSKILNLNSKIFK